MIREQQIDAVARAAGAWIAEYNKEQDLEDPTNVLRPAQITCLDDIFLEVMAVAEDSIDKFRAHVEASTDVVLGRPMALDRSFTCWRFHMSPAADEVKES